MEPTELKALLDRCRQGDTLAWEAFVRQFQRRIYSIACGYAANAEDARDFAQDIFVRLYETRGRWAPADGFTAWMVRVARNVCLDELRRRKARPPAHDVQADEMLDLADGGPTPEVALGVARDRQIVWRALSLMGRLCRDAARTGRDHQVTVQQGQAGAGPAGAGARELRRRRTAGMRGP